MTYDQIRDKVREFMDWVQEHKLTAVIAVVDLPLEDRPEDFKTEVHNAAVGDISDLCVLQTLSNKFLGQRVQEIFDKEQAERTERN